MALVAFTDNANSLSLKRALSLDTSSPRCSSPKSAKVFDEAILSCSLHTPSSPQLSVFAVLQHRHSASLDKARRHRTRKRPSMSGIRNSPAQQLPSFASVFGEEAKTYQPVGQQSPFTSGFQQADQERPQTSADFSSRMPIRPDFSTYHQQRGSTSTSNSENSADSSPTTTVSTLDSSSMTETSPSVSPESPVSNLSPGSFNGDSLRLRRSETENLVFAGTGQHVVSDASARQFIPSKKGRNLKNLAVNTSQAYALGKAISTAQFPLGQSGVEPKQERTSAPASPSFIKPPTPPRRKPTNLGLSIMTPGPAKALPALTIPQTPSLKRPNTLRHFQSSPSLPLMTSGLPPEGGMQLPPIQVNLQPSGFAEVPMEDDEEEAEPNFDVPQSREDKPEAYPDGPIRIYESGVDLYLEPTAEIASRYDVIFNVASEVKNPFAASHLSAPQIQMSSNVGVLTKESQQQQSGSPTTPKATPLAEKPLTDVTLPGTGQPEYIHIPWEHNTDIVPDLHRLVEDIDKRVQQGKRVLVHCQCGVSRSASLIVAYGLYKNPELSVQEAYNAVKKRSKWIGPNMNLIMQLQEFKAGLQRRGNSQYMFGLPRKLSSAISPTLSNADTNASQTPRTAPLHLDTSPQRASTGNMPLTAGAVQRGPSPAFFDPNFRRSWDAGKVGYHVEPPPMPTIGTSAYISPRGQVVPVLKTAAEQASSDVPSDSQALKSKQPSLRKSVPNFSKRLPLRPETEDAEMGGMSIDGALASSWRDASLVPSITAPRPENNFNMFAPTGFELLKPQRRTQKLTQAAPAPSQASSGLLSPRSEHFAMAPLSANRAASEDTHGLFSPMASHFPMDSPRVPAPSAPRQDSFVPSQSLVMDDVKSPRSDTFGMIGFSHSQDHDDGYGIMSPVKTSFGDDPWAALLGNQQQGGQGLQRERSQTPQPDDYSRRTSTPPALTDASSPDGGATPSPPPVRHLGTAPRTLKAKFSSPNLAEQRRLQQLQTEIEAQLPSISPRLGSSDEDAMMSPRATEFTNNPFHGPIDDAQGAPQEQSRPSPKPQQNHFDPRSPAQLGISPITRNIYDVL